jgi:hypothetical protein
VSVAILALSLAAPLHAGPVDHRTMSVTFGTPVELPGVALARGTYVFELAAPDTDPSIVRVLSWDRSTVYLTAFTQLERRPADRKARTVSLGEAASGRAAAVIAWYPERDANGRRFIYPDGRGSVAGLAD